MNGYSQKGILHNGAFLLARLTGLVVTDGENVKILKYHNETKILHGLAELVDENWITPWGKNGQFGFSHGEVQE
jgi:hypothetical protein